MLLLKGLTKPPHKKSSSLNKRLKSLKTSSERRNVRWRFCAERNARLSTLNRSRRLSLRRPRRIKIGKLRNSSNSFSRFRTNRSRLWSLSAPKSKKQSACSASLNRGFVKQWIRARPIRLSRSKRKRSLQMRHASRLSRRLPASRNKNSAQNLTRQKPRRSGRLRLWKRC